MTTNDRTRPVPDFPAGKLRQNTTGGSEPREQRQALTTDTTAPRGQEPPEVAEEQAAPSPSPVSLVQLPPGATFGRSDPVSPQERERLAAYAARVLAEMEGESDRRVVPAEHHEKLE